MLKDALSQEPPAEVQEELQNVTHEENRIEGQILAAKSFGRRL